MKYLLFFYALSFGLVHDSKAQSHVRKGWVSGGGEMIRDRHNPWFFTKKGQLPRSIHYCIEVGDSFGVKRYDVVELTQSALRFWKNQFAVQRQTLKVPYDFELGREFFAFRDGSCRGDEPLKFFFGVLDDSLAQRMNSYGWNPKHHLGIAIRTSYNAKSMQGKGFIYLAPESGPLKPVGNIRKHFWQDHQMIALQQVIRHELGHVFGLQHRGGPQELMGARSSEHIVAQTTTPFNLSLTGFSISPLRRAFPYLLGCVSGKETRLFEFLGTQPRKGCLGVEVSETEMKLSFQDLESDWQVIRKGQYHRKITGVDHLVSLWLTPEQEVFENPENKLFIFGVPSLSMRVTSGEGLPQTLIVDLESIAHSIIVDNGQVFHNILDIK